MLTSSQFVKIHLNLTPPVHQSGSFVSAPIGGKVTLHCFHDSERIYWYRQTLGQKPTPIASFYVYGKETIFHGEFKNNSRLDLVKGDRTNHLIISNLRISDSATYFCGKSNAQVVAFAQGTVVSVKSFDSDVKVLIHQLVSESLQPEGSATLNCTVKTGSGGGEHRVYWFKNSDGFQPGFLYTQGSKNDQSERNSNTPTHTCVHRLSMDDPSVSDAGSYHCAVASCGHILFENATMQEFSQTNSYLFIFAIIINILYKLSHKINILICFHVYFQVNDQDMTVLYASINVGQSNRSRRQRESSKTECVYSSVSQRKSGVHKFHFETL
uniref:Uncharacterized LOC106941586 n=1 Tax=Poecilia latipinna TaxID=48699 RepID=A0A3B3URZ8_9TELE